MGMYEAVYCAASAVGAYAVAQMMDMLYGKSRTRGAVRCLPFTVYFVGSVIVYLVLDIPILNLLFNIFGFLALSYNYDADMKKRLFITILMCGMGVLIEAMIWICTENIKMPANMFESANYSSISGIILNHLWLLAIVMFFKNIKEIKGRKDMPFIYWACLISVPLFSMYFVLALILAGNALSIQMVFSIIALFIVNISMMTLYDYVVKSMSDKAERMLLEEQNRSYQEQIKIMQASFLSMKALKHDLKNHFVALENMLRMNQAELASQYIEDILKEQSAAKEVRSGNIVVDSILGFKLQSAESEKIKCSFAFLIPEQLQVLSKDMVAVLGNIFDNAIEAVRRLPEEERWISMDMKYDKNCLIIQESNPYDGRRKKDWKTIKEDEKNHGMGLDNIRKIAKAYDGWCDIDEKEKNIFKITVVLHQGDEENRK